MTRALAILEDLRRAAAADAPKVTITGLLVKACAYALARHPEANAAFGGDHIAQWDEIHIGVAVSGEGGLLVPVVHHADRLGLHAIARRLEDLAARARSGGLRLPDLQGGTFTISNLGMYGVDHFTAIVNPPQAAILAVGRVAPRPVAADDGSLAARPTATLTLTADHRVLDGAGAARFLQTIQAALERPGLLLA
jgi:pyruvate dehydrogenase E2 component (dihydrolipoamide acetyltransferase)